MPSIDRRRFIAATTAALAAPSLARAQAPVTIKMGALKLIHSIAPHFYERFTPAGYKVEVIPFESPTDCKNGVRHRNRSTSACSASPPSSSARPPRSRWW